MTKREGARLKCQGLYMEQIQRAQRYLERIRSFYKGVQAPYHSVNGFEDDLISFFMHCYHIRDWIIHLNRNGLTAKDVDEFINSYLELKICADFCNGSKHFKLSRGTRTDHQPQLASRNFEGWHFASLSGETKPNIEKANFTILANGKTHDALELAEKCYSLWVRYYDTNCT